MDQEQVSRAHERIVVSGVGKSFGSLEVFRGIDLTVGEAEILALVGPSGCGKTTLLRCIDGLIPVSDGAILIDGEEVVKPRQGVAMVFQHFGLFPWKTVVDNVGYGLKMAGVPKQEIRERVPDFIKMVGLEGFENAYPYQLSGGMQQRAGLARALAVEPRVLLMDEPFAAVDAQTRADLEDLIRGLWQRFSMTVLFITHDIDEAVYLGQRVLVLSSSPTVVQDDVWVYLPAERDQLTTRSDQHFTDLRARVYSEIQNAKNRQAVSTPAATSGGITCTQLTTPHVPSMSAEMSTFIVRIPFPVRPVINASQYSRRLAVPTVGTLVTADGSLGNEREPPYLVRQRGMNHGSKFRERLMQRLHLRT
jgi:NitT/TauT family transport system ATP-binding protein